MRHIDRRVVRALVACAGVCGIAALAIAASGSVSIHVGPVHLRARGPARALGAAIVFALLGAAAGRAAVADALAWWWTVIETQAARAAVVLAALATIVGLAWGTFVAGGSDSYCYLNQAELFARGAVRDLDPLATDPAWPGTVWSFAPAGHTPSKTVPGAVVPICPPGYPVIMAGVRVALGRTAMFWVTPLMGGVAVFLAFLIGRRLGGPAAGLLGAMLTASSPTFLYQIVQPMNDITTAALWCAAVVVARRTDGGAAVRALWTGLLAGMALTVRPNLAPLAAVTALICLSGPPARPLRDRAVDVAVFGAAAAPGLLFVMLIQNAMYGSPLASGYGDPRELFAASHILPNLQRYTRWLLEVHTPFIAAAAAAPFVLRGDARRQAIWLLIVAIVTVACYLPYVVFDAWWYTRFLLPAIPLLLALAAAVVAAILHRAPPSIRSLVFYVIASGLTIIFLRTAVDRDVFRLRGFEWRYRSTGEYVTHLPSDAAFVTGHQTGSLRFYSGRSAVGWGDIDPGRLAEALAFLRRHGRHPYLLFESWEEPDFKKRFAGDPLGQLDWPPIIEIDGNVRIYDPEDADRHRRGETVRTEQVVTTAR